MADLRTIIDDEAEKVAGFQENTLVEPLVAKEK